LVQKPDEYFDKDLTHLIHLFSAARVRAFLNACEIPPSVYRIFDGGIAPYACFNSAAHSPDWLFNSDLTCMTYVVTTPEKLASLTDEIRAITSVNMRKAFLNQLLSQPSEDMKQMGSQEDYYNMCGQFPNSLISCLVGGPLTGLLNTHTQFPSLTDLVVEIRMMSMALTGEKNLFGNNFNIMVHPEATKLMLPLFQSLGLQIVCVSSETCKTPFYTVSESDIQTLSENLMTQTDGIRLTAAIIDQWTGVKGAVQPCYDAVVVESIHDLVCSVDVVPINYKWITNPKPQISQIPGLENTGLAITQIIETTALTPDSLYSPGVYITGTTFTGLARELFLDLFRKLN